MPVTRLLKTAVVILAMVVGTSGLSAQLRVRPVGELPNDTALRLMLRKLATSATFMETDAHPDDEDNALLALMSHGRGLRTVLVTATRGDGGLQQAHQRHASEGKLEPDLHRALVIA